MHLFYTGNLGYQQLSYGNPKLDVSGECLLATAIVNRMEIVNLPMSLFLRGMEAEEKQEQRKYFTSKHQIWVHLCTYRTWAK